MSVTRAAESAKSPWHIEPVSIRNIRPEISGVATYELEFVEPAAGEAYQFAPGQFNMLYLPGAGEIAISVSDDPHTEPGEPRRFAHTIRNAGSVTGTLARMEAGQTLGLRGPFGTQWPMDACRGRDVIMVSGGIGLAPLRPVLYTLLRHREQFGRLHLLHGGRTPDTLLYADEYPRWVERGLQLETTVDRSGPGWNGNVGVVTLLLERLRGFDPAQSVLLCCGPEVMMKFAVRAARKRGLSPQQIWVSMERNMQCAVGFCGHCQLGPEFICKDGPVFRHDRIARWMEVEAL